MSNDEVGKAFPFRADARGSTQPVSGTDRRTPEKVSVIGPTLSFKGDLTAGEDLLIQGSIEGTINHTAQNLTIGEQGTVTANIRARNIVVQGQVEGDLFGSESVVVEETAKVRGNIHSPRVGIAEGAKFKGGIDMEISDKYH